MTGFSRLRFRAYAKDLEQAVIRLSEEMAPHGWPIRRKPEEQKPVSDANSNYQQNVTPLPPVEIAPVPDAKAVVQAEPLKRSITGASNLGSSIAALVAAIKGEVDAAHADLQSAAVEVRTGINTVKTVAKAMRSEANDIKSSLGQFSNMGPE
jgi:hypothetical protein